MQTHDTDGRPSPSRLVRWSVPGLAGVAGLGYLVAGIVGGQVDIGVAGLVIMALAGAGFVLLTRVSETAAGLATRSDERINSIDRDASLVAGLAVLAAVLVLFMVEIARGEDGSPYYQLSALGGVTYLAALVWLRLTR